MISVGIANNYRLDDSGFESRQGEEMFIFSKTAEILSGAYPASSLMCPGVSSRGKAEGSS
jgi:hypothetical protein